MEAIIQTGGVQFRVAKGQVLTVNKLDGAAGDVISFDVLATFNDTQAKIGQPLITGAAVKAKILGFERGEKVISATYKRRKGYHKKRGHRQELSKIQIEEIQA